MEPLNIKHLDFSECHMLDHWPFTRYCHSLPGGIRRHLDLAWDFKWSMVLRRNTTCRVGRHRFTLRKTREPLPGWRGCRACGAETYVD